MTFNFDSSFDLGAGGIETTDSTESASTQWQRAVARLWPTYGAADAGSLGVTSESPAPRATPHELAARHAPVLVVPDGKYDLPADPAEFIENSVWWEEDYPGKPLFPTAPEGRGQIGDNTAGDRNWWGFGLDDGDDFTPARVGEEGGGRQSLNLDDNMRDQLGSENAPFFYQTEVDADGNTTRITYWFFYAYNDGPGPQNHEGDFERITIGFDPETQEPTRARYSAHSNEHTAPIDYRSLETYDGRPIVYVARGTHASYPYPGDYDSDSPLFASAGVLDDNTAAGFSDEHATIIDTANNLHDVTQQAWFPQQGAGVLYGEIGAAHGLPWWENSSSGPYGPSADGPDFDGKNHLDLGKD